MKNLFIKGEQDIPQVQFDNEKGFLFMGGSSLPENVKEFFNPIMSWIEEYQNAAKANTIIEFRFDYLNTASTNMMARIVEKKKKIKETCKEIFINWYYSTGDYDMRELGEELLEGTKCHYTLIEKEI